MFKVGGGSIRGDVIGYVFLFFNLIRKLLFSLYSLGSEKGCTRKLETEKLQKITSDAFHDLTVSLLIKIKIRFLRQH